MSTDSHPCRSLIMSHPIYNHTVQWFLDLEAKVDEEEDEDKEDKDKENKEDEKCMFLLNLQLFYF